MPCEKIEPNEIYIHDELRLAYRVEDVRWNATEWEEKRKFAGKIVNYVQLEDAGFPAGTKYSRSEEDFKANFTPSADIDR